MEKYIRLSITNASGIGGEGTETNLGNQGMDKLLCVRLHENGNERRGRTFDYKAAGNHLETMENTEKSGNGDCRNLELGKDLARQTSYMGDHYQWVVLILAWCVLHQDEFMQNWELSKDGKPLNRINPLV